MALTISDDLLRGAGLTEELARVEIACRMFEAGKLSLPAASRWAGQTRTEFEEELMNRQIAVFRPSAADLDEDLATMERFN